MTPIEAALAAIKSRNLGDSPNYTKIAEEFGVVRSTLARRHKAISTTLKVKGLNQQKLSPQQEIELVRYIEKLTKRGLPPTRQMIKNFASCIVKSSVSTWWVDQFIRRHSASLISKWATGIDRNRHKADSESKYKLYFELLQQKITQYEIEPCNTYNMDEKGFLLGITSRTKRIFSRSMYERKEVRQSIQDGSRE
jgi:Tc5 transposase-like DNA-binding protein